MNEQKTWESGVQRFRKGSPRLRKRGTKETLGGTMSVETLDRVGVT